MHTEFQPIAARAETAAKPLHQARKTAFTAMVAVVFVLAGCSSMRIVDSDVNAFIAPATVVAVPASYRFDRLPSQQAQPQSSQAMEGLAEVELAKVGMKRDDAAPQYSVQLELRSFRDPQAPWDDPRYLDGFSRRYPFVTRYGVVMRNSSLNLALDFPYYRRDIVLIMRRISDGQVVFESRAKHDGRWPDEEAVLPAMLQAALAGFPNPPQGLHRVVVEIPR